MCLSLALVTIILQKGAVEAFSPSSSSLLDPRISTMATRTTTSRILLSNKKEKNHHPRRGLLVVVEGALDPNNQGENSKTSSRILEAPSTNTKNNKGSNTNINLQQLERSLSVCKSGTAARRVLESTLLSNTDDNALYKSISIPPESSAKGLSDGDLAIMTRIRNSKYSILDVIDLNGNRDADRASVAVLSVFTASTLSALVAHQNLPGPEIVRFIVVWLFSFAPLALVGFGIADVAKLQTLLVSIQRQVFPAYRTRMIQHEAGHFLMSHLLGFPIAKYSANAVKNAVEFYPLNDADAARDRASRLGFDKQRVDNNNDDDILTLMANNDPYFSEKGRGSEILNQQSVFRKEEALRQSQKMNYTAFLQLPDANAHQNNPRASWPFRGLDDTTMDQLCVISVAGVCAEILAYGNAEGGLADFNQLKILLANYAEDVDGKPMTEREIDNRIRFALGYGMSQLRRHLGALDALADVMERGGSIAECVYAIETCPNISGNDGIMEEYESRRKKERFQKDRHNPLVKAVEKVFLGDIKTADVQEDRLVQGKGGGYIEKKGPLLTGDDPFYLALGVAAVFLLWASAGGLSLH